LGYHARMPEDTIFTKIINGEIPCHRVYEDDHVFAFLDIAPLSEGHTLVVPKEPAPTMGDLSDDAAAALGRALPRICRAVCEATGTTQYNLLQNNGERTGQVVMHVHFHVIPKPASGGGLVMEWGSEPVDHARAATLASRIASLVGAGG
jgi:histidine triad (HIT) family protein